MAASIEQDDVPVYLRLRATIVAAILRGDYRTGDQLPSVAPSQPKSAPIR